MNSSSILLSFAESLTYTQKIDIDGPMTSNGLLLDFLALT